MKENSLEIQYKEKYYFFPSTLKYNIKKVYNVI